MTPRRLTAFIEALLGNRRPRPFSAAPGDVDAMRAAIELRAAQPGASLPTPEFVAGLHHRLREQLGEPATEDRDAAIRRLTRRRLLTGAAGVAAAAVAGAVIDHDLIAPSGPGPAADKTLLADNAAWLPVASGTDVAGGQIVHFTTKHAVGFVSSDGQKLRAVSGACTHQGCLLALNQSAGRLDCPCHRASFSPAGDVISHEFPQPLRPLPQLPVREVDGRIEVYLPNEA